MRQLDHHPLRTLGGLLVLAFVLFMLSGIPALKDARSGIDFVLGEITWFGFLLTALAFLVVAVVIVVRAALRRRPA